jgi:1-acyl-sn-glycerol-3-phosphate acyltransferase
MGTFALPLYYSAYFKKVIWRPLMLELTNYVRPFRVIKTATLPSDKNYIVCWHPHGRLFYGFAVFCGLFDVFFPELNRREFFGAINEPLFSIPFLRNMLALTGTIGCSRKALDRALKVCLEDKTHNVYPNIKVCLEDRTLIPNP